MRRFLPLILILLLASAALGWLRAGGSAGAAAEQSDEWDSLQLSQPSGADYAYMAARLKNSGLLPAMTREEMLGEQENVETQPEAAQRTVPFPKILGTSRIGGKRFIHLRLDEDRLSKFQQGDVLDSGWEILKIDRRQVVAVFDGEELEIPVISYLEAAFEKPEDAGENTEADDPSRGE